MGGWGMGMGRGIVGASGMREKRGCPASQLRTGALEAEGRPGKKGGHRRVCGAEKGGGGCGGGVGCCEVHRRLIRAGISQSTAQVSSFGGPGAVAKNRGRAPVGGVQGRMGGHRHQNSGRFCGVLKMFGDRSTFIDERRRRDGERGRGHVAGIPDTAGRVPR